MHQRRRRARRVPSFRQMETTECGAACLAMILAYHGRWESLDTMRDSCGASRDGTSAAALVQVAERHGLEAAAFHRDVPDLASLPLPQILFWGFDHFVVLEAVRADHFIINDPAFGRRRLGREEFGRRYTGVTLSFRPGADFAPRRRGLWAMRRVTTLLRGSGPGLATVVTASFTAVVLAALVPGLTRVFVDDYLVEGHRDWLAPLLGGIIAMGALRSILAWLHLRVLVLLQSGITNLLTARFVWRLFHVPYAFFARRSPVEIAGRTQHAGQLGAIGPLAQGMVSILAMLSYATAMLFYSFWLTMVCVLFAGLEVAVLRLVGRSVREGATQVQIAQAQAHAATVGGVAMLEQAKVNGGETQLFGQMLEAEIRFLNAEQGRNGMATLLAGLPYLVSRLTTLAVLGVGALLVITTELTLGALLGFLMLSALFSQAVGTLTGVSAAIAAAAASAERLGDAMDYGPAEDPVAVLDQATGKIRLQGMGFSYAPGQPMLQDVTLTVEPGECLAVMGASGAGKSTLARLLVGLADPGSGTLTFGTRSGWRPRCDGIGFVDQNPFLPNGSLRSALTFWDPEAPDGEILAALGDVGMAHAVLERPGGIDGSIGEGGIGFSGGERQRLAVARALVPGPRILVLDDATSALDESTEADLLENLRRRAITVILFTNRASAIGHCDRVCGLRDGRLLPVEMELAEAHLSARQAEAGA